MTNKIRATAAALTMLMGLSGAALGQTRQQQPTSNMRTAEYRAPERPQWTQQQRGPEAQRPVQPQRPSQYQPVQQPLRTAEPPRDDDGRTRRMPVPVNRPVVNSYGNDRDHGRPDDDRGRSNWNDGDRDHRRPDWDGDRDHDRPIIVVQRPFYTVPVYVAHAYEYYDAGYAVPVNYATTPQQAGFQDGLADGHNDWVMGFGFRNGFDDNYVNADNGYDPEFGNFQAYQSDYRIAYQEGYTRGYGR